MRHTENPNKVFIGEYFTINNAIVEMSTKLVAHMQIAHILGMNMSARMAIIVIVELTTAAGHAVIIGID